MGGQAKQKRQQNHNLLNLPSRRECKSDTASDSDMFAISAWLKPEG